MMVFIFFKDGWLQSKGKDLIPIPIKHYMTAGSTSAITFKVRIGGSSCTVTFNGQSGGRIFGGVSASSISVTEILPQEIIVQNSPFRLGPLALTNTYTTNIMNPGTTTGGTNGGGSKNLCITLNHVHILNKTDYAV